MKLALELLSDEIVRLQNQISITGDATGIYTNRIAEVKAAIKELSI